ncbi:MAG: VCBS repeat-containing protein [Verrucomicrobia bacterium]|nr:VCBS repeat-containing protein [Verrucomicrobiota bacterium]
MTPLSPRRRRLRWTLALLGAAFVVGGVLGVLLYQRSRPVAYRPDERPDDITSELARGLPPDAPRPRFTDVTRAAGLAEFRNFAGDRTSQLPEDMGPGLAWGDFDNDGDDDLFLVSAGGALTLPEDRLLPCALLENLGNGTFRRVDAFPELRLRGLGAAWGDYDGDGFLDLAVAGYDALVLLRNEGGTGRFTRDPRLPHRPGFWSGVAWGDFDNDRRPDLYVCQYVRYLANDADRDKISDQLGTAVPYTLNPASYAAGLNALFHQQPDGSFRDMAAELKVQNPEGRSLGALWHDLDQDGWLDLYVANDVSDNVWYRNTGGRFEDLSHPALIADYRSAMGLAVGDFDRDGDDDLFVSHWVAQENALYESLLKNPRGSSGATTNSPAASPAATPTSPTPAEARAAPPRRRSPVMFLDVADRRGLGQIALPYVGWGSEFADLDHDGWLDLLVANGSTLEADGPPPKKLQPQELFLFWNQHGEFFHNLAPLHPGLAEKHVSRGLACADYDLDGDLDFAVADLYEGVRLFRNDLAKGHWLKVRLRSKNAAGVANGFGDGSTVIAWVNGVPLRRSVTGVSYLSQGSHTLHWGLGTAARVDRLEVRWHAGGTNIFEGVEANAFYELAEGDTTLRRLTSGAGAGVASDSGRPASGSRQPAPTPVTGASRNAAVAAGEAPAAAAGTPAKPAEDKQRLLQFWNTQRAAMNAMKVERDNARAVRLFREAIALNPRHEDSRYYLGLCLASLGDVDGALAALEGLQQLNPQSHRAWQQWGVIRAQFARNDGDLAAAEQALERAHSINPEETGALLVLGEVALLRGNLKLAEERLAAATHTNPKAVGGFFLRGYLAWKRGDAAAARHWLEQARAALGPDWQPKGATSEGDVKQKQHVESSPLNSFWNAWDGQTEPDRAFAALDRRLTASLNQPAAAGR